MDKAILVGLELGLYDTKVSLNELQNIANALNISVEAVITQKLATPNVKTYVGSGKLEEIKKTIAILDITIVIFDDELSPSQIRNLEDILDVQIIDRSFLILSIFTERAKTKSALIEVSLAQQKYLLPRLVGMRKSLSRQGGGSYNAKGPGETKLELDRRLIEKNIVKLEKSLKKLNRQKQTETKTRRKSGIPIVSLVGYTNAGKSATLNAIIKHLELTTGTVFEKDLLFATLDTNARQITKKGYPPFILSDTIGFLSRLPLAFINSFKSTLSEIKNSDLIIHIIDGTSKNLQTHLSTTQAVLQELSVNYIPTINIYTKLDLLSQKEKNDLYISNKTLENINTLIDLIYLNLFGKKLFAKLHVPYNKLKIMESLNKNTEVLNITYDAKHVIIDTKLFEKQLPVYRDYIYKTVNSKSLK